MDEQLPQLGLVMMWLSGSIDPAVFICVPP